MSMLSTNEVICPPSLLKQADGKPIAPTAVVNAGSKLVLESAKLSQQHKLIEPVLVGDTAAIKTAAAEIGWDISDLRVVQAADEAQAAATSVSLAREKEVTALMKGNVHTDTLLRAVLEKESGIRTDAWLSHVFHMSVPQSDQALCITDAAVNVAPNLKTKLHIARNATELFHSLGNDEPKIAVLSATESPTEAMPSSMEAAELVTLAESGEVPGAILGGPLAFDNAMSPKAAKLKKIDHPVAGNADCLLVPNIETGNALFKQMVYFMGAAAAGIVLGAKVPITLTSRADPAAARLASAALASILAAHRSQ